MSETKKKYQVMFVQQNTLYIEVEAEDSEVASELAEEILSNKTFDENIDECDRGYFELADVDELEE